MHKPNLTAMKQLQQAQQAQEQLQQQNQLKQKQRTQKQQLAMMQLQQNQHAADESPYPIIELTGISYTYSDHPSPAISIDELRICSGQWVWIVGNSGAGKSTLCGVLSGLYRSWTDGSLAGKISFPQLQAEESPQRAITALSADESFIAAAVFQHPEMGLVMDVVEDELAFGPENLCVPPAEIECRIDLALQAVHLPDVRHRSIRELSGGQQQRIAIASALTMYPEMLVLDDAMAHLDPASITHLLEALQALHRSGQTIVTATSRLDESTVSYADRIIVLHEGKVLADGTPQDVLSKHTSTLVALGCWPEDGIDQPLACSETSATHPFDPKHDEPLCRIQSLSFAYSSSPKAVRHQAVLQDVHLTLQPGDFLAVLGPNGSGKTTLGKLLAGLLPAPRNSIFLNGQDMTLYNAMQLAHAVGYVFQNPAHQFVADTVLEECIFGLRIQKGLPPWSEASGSLIEDLKRTGEELLQQFDLEHCRDLHPQQLSIAEKRLLNLVTAIVLEPSLIVLDEPTAGLDYVSANRLMEHCKHYANQGKSIVMITHDLLTVKRWATQQLVLS